MRLNSSVSCARIPRSQFPTTCDGKDPFTTSFQHGGNFTRVCVPGSSGTSPWTQSRSRQDISENLYVDILEQLEFHNTGADQGNYTSDFTLHCDANSTRGYFELGNYRNNYTWGPLLEKWPSKEELTQDYNDFQRGSNVPEDSNATAPEPEDVYDSRSVPGPLTTAAIALFGNDTFFDMGTASWNGTANRDPSTFSWNDICTLLPFGQVDPPPSGASYYEDINRFPICRRERKTATWQQAYAQWLHGFNDTQTANKAISTAVYLANEIFLTANKWDTNFKAGGILRSDSGRLIYSGSGTNIRKPAVSMAAMIVVSGIIFLELVVLGLLAWLIYRGPSRTRSLDAIAFTKLKTSMEES